MAIFETFMVIEARKWRNEVSKFRASMHTSLFLGARNEENRFSEGKAKFSKFQLPMHSFFSKLEISFYRLEWLAQTAP